MIDAGNDSQRQLRWAVYWLLIAVAVGNMTGRLMSVNSVNRMDIESHLINRRLAPIEKELISQNLSEAERSEKLEAARDRITAEHTLQRPFLSANDRSRWLAIRALGRAGDL